MFTFGSVQLQLTLMYWLSLCPRGFTLSVMGGGEVTVVDTGFVLLNAAESVFVV